MATQLEMLQADLREVQAHLAVWPNDEYAEHRLHKIYALIEGATPPAMSHQRQRADFDSKPKSICHVCKDKSDCTKCPFCQMPFAEAQKVEAKVKDVTAEWDFGGPNVLRFTFGEDPDMDERWIADERIKAKGVREDQRTLPPRVGGVGYDPDNFMFPTMAYDLTSLHNLKYGTKNY